MMKYLLLLLLLIVTSFAPSAGPAPAPLAARLDLDASFDLTSGRDAIHVYVFASRWPDRARVALSIDESDPTCGPAEGCAHRLLAGDGRTPAPLGDVVVARDLRWAAVHAAIPFTDNVARRTFTVRVDLVLHARGDFHRSDGSDDPGYVNATVNGIVASTSTTFVGADQVSVHGTIARSEV